MRRTTALIVGGGPAGSMAAISLAKSGVEALVLERHRKNHDALCGGFLSWRTLQKLGCAGLPHAVLRGHPIQSASLFTGDKTLTARLPHPGIGLSRYALDKHLLAQAESAGAHIERGVSVREARAPARVRLADGAEVAADALFLATGKHDLRGLKRSVDRKAKDPWMGIRYRLDASQSLRQKLDGVIELHLFRGGYAGLLLQEDGSANLCMALRRSRLSEVGGDPLCLLDALAIEAPSLGDRVSGETVRNGSDAVGQVPYGWRAVQTEPAVFRLGDQAAVIPSLAGEGVGIAVASGEAAANAFLRGGAKSAATYQRHFAERARRPLWAAGMLKRLSENPSGARRAMILARMPGAVSLAMHLTRIT